MRKRTQLNIEIDDDLLKSLKLLAIQKNIKLWQTILGLDKNV